MGSPEFIEVDCCASTQILAREWLENNLNPSADMVWIRANSQSAGRGRQDRVWQDHSQGKNLLCSCGFRLDSAQLKKTMIPLIAGVAIREAVLSYAPELRPRLSLKWPNDLVLTNAPPAQAALMPTEKHFKKLGGVLAESFSAQAIVVGWGLNIDQAPALNTAAALSEALKNPPQPQVLLKKLSQIFKEQLMQWKTHPHAYETKLIDDLNREAMRFFWGLQGRDPTGLTATALGLEPSGALKVRLEPEGPEKSLFAGDFTFFASGLSKF